MDSPVTSHVFPSGSVELKLRRLRIEVIRTELEVGMTLLDVAECTRESRHRHRCVLGAIAALDTASRYSGSIPFEIQEKEIQQRYDALRDRLLMTVNGPRARDEN
jgi:hypothetical protein